MAEEEGRVQPWLYNREERERMARKNPLQPNREEVLNPRKKSPIRSGMMGMEERTKRPRTVESQEILEFPLTQDSGILPAAQIRTDTLSPAKRRRQEINHHEEDNSIPLFLPSDSPVGEILITPPEQNPEMLDYLLDVDISAFDQDFYGAHAHAYEQAPPQFEKVQFEANGILGDSLQPFRDINANPIMASHLSQTEFSSSLPSLDFPVNGQLPFVQPIPGYSSPSPEYRAKTIAPHLTLMSGSNPPAAPAPAPAPISVPAALVPKAAPARASLSVSKAEAAEIETLASVRDGLDNFLRLRGQKVASAPANNDANGGGAGLPTAPPPAALPPASACAPEVQDQRPEVPRNVLPRSALDEPIPNELLRCGELRCSDLSVHPHHHTPHGAEHERGVHRYIASLSLIQKRILTSKLTNEYSIELVERASASTPYSLHQAQAHQAQTQTQREPDLVLDPLSCILLYPLAHLPSSSDHTVLLTDICRLSWSYSRITILFEAYSGWKSFRPPRPQAGDIDSDSMEPYPFTPPVVKAVRALRVGLSMSEEEKDEACHVSFGFARCVEECAGLIRSVGECAEEMAWAEGLGAVWDDRQWLTAEEWEVADENC